MKLFSNISLLISRGATRLIKTTLRNKIIIGVVAALCVGGIIWFFSTRTTTASPTYETAIAEKGTLIASISGSGTITTGNTTSITTGATGTVTAVYAKNGDTVKKGAKIAEISLDEYGQKRVAAAWLSYTNALTAVKTAQADKTKADLDMWNYRQAILTAEDNIDYKDTNPINPTTSKEYTLNEKTVIDKTLQQAKDNFSAAEMKYKNADAAISNASVRIASAWYDYEQVSSVVTAPEEGMIENLTLAVGTTISNSSDSSISISDGTTTTSNSSNSNTLTASSQSVGTIRSTEGLYKATVNLTEIDIPSIQSDQKVTLTMSAFPDNTFTGRVLAVDTNGLVSSGVTSYPVTILMDPTTINIYPKMAVDVQIITLVKPDVLLIPTTAIQTDNGVSTVQVMKDKKIRTVTVEVGKNNDTETEIVSGLSAGDTVVTSTITAAAKSQSSSSTTRSSSNNNSTRSVFSGSGGFGGGPGGF